MIPIIEDFVKLFYLDYFVVVAHFLLISKSNISLLQYGGNKFIGIAIIKNEAEKN